MSCVSLMSFGRLLKNFAPQKVKPVHFFLRISGTLMKLFAFFLRVQCQNFSSVQQKKKKNHLANQIWFRAHQLALSTILSMDIHCMGGTNVTQKRFYNFIGVKIIVAKLNTGYSRQKCRFGILLPKLFQPTVRKNCSTDREKLLKFEAEGREFAKFLRSLEQFIQTVKGQNNFW